MNYKLSLSGLSEFSAKVKKLLSDNPSQAYYVGITKTKKKRSIPANNQYYAWIPAISDFTCIDLRTTRNELKLDFGLPIILADEQIGQMIGEQLNSVGFFNLSRDRQVNFMELLSVTSLMSTEQHNIMRDNILYFYNTAGLNIGYENNS